MGSTNSIKIFCGTWYKNWWTVSLFGRLQFSSGAGSDFKKLCNATRNNVKKGPNSTSARYAFRSFHIAGFQEPISYCVKGSEFIYHFRRLRTLMSEDEDSTNWDLLIDPVLFSIRSCRSTTTKMSPFWLMYGREARRPIEIADDDQERDVSEVRQRNWFIYRIWLHCAFSLLFTQNFTFRVSWRSQLQAPKCFDFEWKSHMKHSFITCNAMLKNWTDKH